MAVHTTTWPLCNHSNRKLMINFSSSKLWSAWLKLLVSFFLPTFRDNVSVQSWRVKQCKKNAGNGVDGDWCSENVLLASRVSGQFMSCPVFNRTENIHDILFEFHVMRRRRELWLNSVFWCKTDFRIFTRPKLIVLFCVLFVCKCVPHYCHRVSTRLQLNMCLYLSTAAESCLFLDMNVWTRKLTFVSSAPLYTLCTSCR